MKERRIALVLAFALGLGVLFGRWAATRGVLASPAAGGIPDRKGLIHSCYKLRGGALRVIDPSRTKCSSDEQKLGWAQSTAGASYTFQQFTAQVPNDTRCSTDDHYPCVVATADFATAPLSMTIMVKESDGTLVANPTGLEAAWRSGKLLLQLDPVGHLTVPALRSSFVYADEKVTVDVFYTAAKSAAIPSRAFAPVR